jgi:hypothetical protein
VKIGVQRLLRSPAELDNERTYGKDKNVMNRELAGAVVGCLRVAGEAPDLNALRHFKARDWQRTFRWLDRSGLTLYFLRRLQSLAATELLPPSILARFEETLTQHRRRLDYIANEFALVNERFRRAGVNFAVIKGFSLVPAFCPDALLRAVSDLDYLVDKQSLPVAQRVLAEVGYCPGHFSGNEFKFCRPSSRIPTVSDNPYSRETEPLIELHLAFWNRANRVALNEPEFRLDQTISHDWQGLRFPVLKEEEAFVLQVLHVFQHTLEYWIKLCWLLEIGYFLRARSLDTQFWDRVNVRLREVPRLVEFAAVVMGLAERIIAAPMPPIAANWTQTLPRVARSWLESYGRKWAIEEHPLDGLSLFSTAKLALFLHREFASDPQVRKEITRRRLFPRKRSDQIAVPAEKTAASFLAAQRLQWQFVLQRMIYHFGSDLRYLWELPRWRELNRAPAGSPRGGLHESQT